MLFFISFTEKPWNYFFFVIVVLTELHVLGCLEQNLVIFSKYLSVNVFVCETLAFCCKCSLKINAPHFMKLLIQLNPDISWRLSTFRENWLTNGAFVMFFRKSFGVFTFYFLLYGTTQNLMYNILPIKNNVNSNCE